MEEYSSTKINYELLKIGQFFVESLLLIIEVQDFLLRKVATYMVLSLVTTKSFPFYVSDNFLLIRKFHCMKAFFPIILSSLSPIVPNQMNRKWIKKKFFVVSVIVEKSKGKIIRKIFYLQMDIRNITCNGMLWKIVIVIEKIFNVEYGRVCLLWTTPVLL